jgi:hypothetical protein
MSKPEPPLPFTGAGPLIARFSVMHTKPSFYPEFIRGTVFSGMDFTPGFLEHLDFFSIAFCSLLDIVGF